MAATRLRSIRNLASTRSIYLGLGTRQWLVASLPTLWFPFLDYAIKILRIFNGLHPAVQVCVIYKHCAY